MHLCISRSHRRNCVVILRRVLAARFIQYLQFVFFLYRNYYVKCMFVTFFIVRILETYIIIIVAERALLMSLLLLLLLLLAVMILLLSHPLNLTITIAQISLFLPIHPLLISSLCIIASGIVVRDILITGIANTLY